jgi:glycine C-acetyltransferase
LLYIQWFQRIILLRMIPTASHTIADIDETLTAFEAIREN